MQYHWRSWNVSLGPYISIDLIDVNVRLSGFIAGSRHSALGSVAAVQRC